MLVEGALKAGRVGPGEVDVRSNEKARAAADGGVDEGAADAPGASRELEACDAAVEAARHDGAAQHSERQPLDRRNEGLDLELGPDRENALRLHFGLGPADRVGRDVLAQLLARLIRVRIDEQDAGDGLHPREGSNPRWQADADDV